MLSSKTRSTVLALVASAGIAAAVAPAASQAQPNWPALGKAIHCESLQAGLEAYEHKETTARSEGNFNLASYYHEMAQQYESEMTSESCIFRHGSSPTVSVSAVVKPSKI